MKRLFSLFAEVLQCGVLRIASLLTPTALRQDWLREWNAELWHIRHEAMLESAFSWQNSWQVERERMAFCLGSFADALCLRGHSGKEKADITPSGASVRQCLAMLAAILGLCLGLAIFLPGVRDVLDTSAGRINPHLVLLESPITSQRFQSWNASRQRYFEELAFYRTTRREVRLPSGHSAAWDVAYSSANLFTLLGLPVRYAANLSQEDSGLPAVLLSQRSWERNFGANPQIVGQLARIGSCTARIAGVVPYGAWRLPSTPDAWLLESDAQLASDMRETAYGHMLGRLTRDGTDFVAGNSITITAYGPNDNDIEFYGTLLSSRGCSPWAVCGFALLLVALTLPAVTSVSLGETQFSACRPAWKRRMARWLFLWGKILLVVAIACVASADLAYGAATFEASTAQLLQFAACFGIGLFGMRWALKDQRHRCPVCLRCVTHPAQVGHASHTFLGWSGTEMMCMGGHTLLHVPSLPTSWFGAQRWLYLDTSWDFLFADF